MPRVAFLIAASPNAAFYSQLAVLSLSIQKLQWTHWVPETHVYFGGHCDLCLYRSWRPYFSEIDVHWASDAQFARDGDWAQSDDVFRFAPKDTDVIVALDADTLLVRRFEDLLDAVDKASAVAAVIAHYPTVLGDAFDPETSSIRPILPEFPVTTVKEAWERIADGIIDSPLKFAFCHTLMRSDAPLAQRLTPFYPNFGVVLFAKSVFERVRWRYLEIRSQISCRLPSPDFSGQAALTLATSAAEVATWSLPLRYNFPNDPIAEQLYPSELQQVTIFHYLRTVYYDRHRIFASAHDYAEFLSLPLRGVNRSFQDAVKQIVGCQYPFR